MSSKHSCQSARSLSSHKVDKVNFARFDPQSIFLIEDSAERENKIASITDALKQAMIKTEKQIADMKQSISTTANENITIREKMKVLDSEYKASQKARELVYLIKRMMTIYSSKRRH
jgi:predicted  nucleic acid-binding Zn-ribbon protein